MIGLSVVLVFDLLQPSPVLADVVERHGEVRNIGEKVSVTWVDEVGSTQMADVIVPEEYVGQDRIPIIPNPLVPYVDDGSVSIGWYLLAAMVGLFVGGPVAIGLRNRTYAERPIRQVTWGSGV